MDAQDTSRQDAWFCLRALPKREQAAADHLRQRVGVEVFAPHLPARRGSGGTGNRKARQPLFPGYLFARFQYPHQVRHVVSTQGVAGIVRFGDVPPVVADGVIEFLRREVRLAEHGEPTPVFREGEKVTVMEGCFRHIEGRVLSSDSATDRVRVLLNILGQDVQVSVLSEQLRVAEARSGYVPPALLVDQKPMAPVVR